MVKKYSHIIASVVFAFASLVVALQQSTVAHAQENLIFGQKHAYSVYVKSNREAFVFARLVLSNPNETPLTKSSFTLSNAKASEMAIYQVVLPQQCVRYDYANDGVCREYEEPNYEMNNAFLNDSNQQDDIEYYQVSFAESDGKYSFQLPKPVDAYKSTAIVAVYATKDYVQGFWGRYSYDFETLAVEQRVLESEVAVSVETDYALKNADRPVSIYSSGSPRSTSGGVLQEGISSMDEPSFSNPNIDRLVFQIGYGGELTKEFKNVTPNETEKVSGVFAKNWFGLYVYELLTTLIVAAGISYGVVVLRRRYAKRVVRSARKNSSVHQKASKQKPLQVFSPAYWLASFVSAVMVIGLTFLISALVQSYSFSRIVSQSILGALFLIIVCLVYIFAIFGPAVYIAIRNKWQAGILVVGLQVVWYVVIAILIAIVVSAGSKNPW